MNMMATVTSKGQLTIPVAILRESGIKSGDKVVVSWEDEVIKINPAVKLVEELAGFVKVPKKYKGMSLDRMIEAAKADYFRNKKHPA